MATAQEGISVETVMLPQGGQGEIVVSYHFNEGHQYVAYQIIIGLPDGVSFIADEYERAAVILPDNQPAALFNIDFPSYNGFLKVYSNPSTPIAGNSGVLARIPIKTTADFEIGQQLQGTMTDIVLATIDAVAVYIDDLTFDMKVVENVVELDENATEAPVATAAPVNIRLHRTINANEWSTLCLPFAMTEAQVKDMFGSDVQLAEFVSYDVDDADNPTSITIAFDNADLSEGLIANYPYIIKTTQPITQINVTSTIEPDEANAVCEYAEGRGSRRHVYGTFIGTYHAGTVVPADNLFLNGNKFWYSTGKTKMKAYRAYFDLEDVIANSDAGAKVNMMVGGVTTDLKPPTISPEGEGSGNETSYRRHLESTYTLNGIPLGGIKGGLQKGIYIRNGRKEVVR